VQFQCVLSDLAKFAAILAMYRNFFVLLVLLQSLVPIKGGVHSPLLPPHSLLSLSKP